MKLGFILFFVFSAGSAFGSPPAKTLACKPPRINAPKNGAGVYFNRDCTTAYVLPPVHGKVQLAGIARHQTLGRETCGSYNDFLKTYRGLSQRLAALYKTDEVKTKPSRPNDGGILPPPAPNHPPAPPLDNPDEEANKIMALQATLLEQLKIFAMLPGAKAKLVFFSEMENIRREYQRLNPGVVFESMPLEAAYLTFTPKDSLAEIPIPGALSAQVPGLVLYNPIEMNPAAEKLDAEAIKLENEKLVHSRTMGASLEGTVMLSLAATCPYLKTNSDELMSPEQISNVFATNLSANLQYVYGLQVYRKYRAKFNLANLVKKIREQTTSGGFFKTSSANKIIEETDSSDWFEFYSDSDDPRYPNHVLAADIKAQLMDRVLQQISFANYGKGEPGALLATPQANGAGSASAGLKENCKHKYCLAAAAVLDVLNATFGSAEATSSFIARNNFWSEDRVDERTTLRFYGSLGFK